jgi:hypothetical protein
MLRNKATEGIFLATDGVVSKVAAVGDSVSGGGVISGFAAHPMPALNDSGSVAFVSAIAGARAGEGIFLGGGGTITAVALTGTDAPLIPGGTFAAFDAPAINNNGDIVFAATVRRGRDTFQVLYLLSNGKFRKLLTENDPFLGGGRFGGFGLPAINNRGVVAFPATLERGPALGGIFVTGTRDLKMLVAAGSLAPDGRMIVRLSERIAIDDEDDIAFGAQIGAGKDAAEAILKVNTSGQALIVATGQPAPGGGIFSGLAPWPAVGPSGRVVFIAAIDGGPGPIGLYSWRAGAVRRLVLSGQTLPDGTTVGPFAINAVASAGANGAVTFVTMTDAEGSAIHAFVPPAD